MMHPDDEAEMDSLAGDDMPPKGEHETVDQEEAEDMADTAVVPVKVLMGKDGEMPKEGDGIVVKVTKMHGDEAEIAYAPKKKEPGEPSMGPDEELDEMGKETAGQY